MMRNVWAGASRRGNSAAARDERCVTSNGPSSELALATGYGDICQNGRLIHLRHIDQRDCLPGSCSAYR